MRQGREAAGKGVLSSAHLGNWSLCPWGTPQPVYKRCLEFSQLEWGSWAFIYHIPSVILWDHFSSTACSMHMIHNLCFLEKTHLADRCEPLTNSRWFVSVCFVAFVARGCLSSTLGWNVLRQPLTVQSLVVLTTLPPRTVNLWHIRGNDSLVQSSITNSLTGWGLIETVKTMAGTTVLQKLHKMTAAAELLPSFQTLTSWEWIGFWQVSSSLSLGWILPAFYLTIQSVGMGTWTAPWSWCLEPTC